MVHLVPEKLERRYSKAQIKKSSRFVTEIVTLGSSLTCYLNNLGIENVILHFIMSIIIIILLLQTFITEVMMSK